MSQQQAAARIVVEPRHQDRQPHILQHKQAQRQRVMHIPWHKKQRQMPECPDQPQDHTGDQRAIAPLQARQREPTPADLFAQHAEGQHVGQRYKGQIPLGRVVKLRDRPTQPHMPPDGRQHHERRAKQSEGIPEPVHPPDQQPAQQPPDRVTTLQHADEQRGQRGAERPQVQPQIGGLPRQQHRQPQQPRNHVGQPKERQQRAFTRNTLHHPPYTSKKGHSSRSKTPRNGPPVSHLNSLRF